MPWNGSGSFGFPFDFTDDRDANIPIDAVRMDGQFDDARVGLENTVTRDGQNSPITDLPMGNNHHTGVSNATARNQYAVVGQVQDDSYGHAVAAGTVDALTAAFTPSVAAFADGMALSVRASGANVTTTPTLSVNGLAAKTIRKFGNQPLEAGDIFAAGHELRLRYNLANDVWELLNPTYSAALLMPIGSLISYAGTVEPTGWAFPYGQTLDSVASPEYAPLYAIIGTTYGGTGPADFQILDARGRVLAGMDDMGPVVGAGRLTGFGQGVDGTVLGAGGGEQAHIQTDQETAQKSLGNVPISSGVSSTPVQSNGGYAGGGGLGALSAGAGTNLAGTVSGNAFIGGQPAIAFSNVVQPTLVLNCIMRVF